jgi:hypothetical protein
MKSHILLALKKLRITNQTEKEMLDDREDEWRIFFGKKSTS